MSSEEISIKTTKTQSKVKSLMALTKMRLSFLVVISSLTGYLFAKGGFGINFWFLIIGGYLITGASNAFNQIIEKELDKKMPRTAKRPLPTNNMSVTEAFIWAIGMTIIGSIILFQINFYSGILGLMALCMYVFIYTPMKRLSPWAVFVGAFPGAIPPMLGVVAMEGEFSLLAGIMFLVQFVWQFPHFWAIAWVSDEDYAKGGFSLLPSKGRKDKRSAIIILISSILLVPAGILPYLFNFTGTISLILGLVAGLWFLYITIQFFKTLDDKLARKLMFASFIYLPIIQFLYVFNHI